MDSAELRALQQPLKDAYREDPEKAVITLRARGQLGRGRLLLGGDRAGAGRRGLAPGDRRGRHAALLG